MNNDRKIHQIVAKKYNGALTTNKLGYMLEIDEPNFAESLDLIRNKMKQNISNIPTKIGDFGVAYGYSSQRLLQCGS
jgi:hypothetical protein